MTDPSKISELIERSSLGTAGARSLRERTPPEVAQRILDRAAEHERTTENVTANPINEGGPVGIMSPTANDLETRRRLSRLKTEAVLLSQQFGNVRFDTQGGTWFYVEQFPISAGWNKTHIELLIDIPHGTPGYPSIPPEWFWTDHDLRASEGQPINRFFAQGPSSDKKHANHEWGHFCVHLISWRPAGGADLMRGHSLITYLNLIAAIFRDRRTLGGARS